MKSILKNINPFKEGRESNKVEFIIQKLLAFIIVYLVSEVVMEGVVIVTFSLAGYDVIHGNMPDNSFVARVPLYGMAGFIVITYLYVRLFEKRKLDSMGVKFNIKNFFNTFEGLVFGAVLVAASIGIMAVAGLVEFEDLGNISISNFIFWFLAYFVQSCTEEFMCRGFIQTSLNRRIGIMTSILISGLVFVAPHLSSMEDMSIYNKIIGVTNILLVSGLFSVAMLSKKCLGIACGLHAGWNFCLGTVFGLTVTGEDSTDAIINMKVNNGYDIITGGRYGIEAGIVIIPVLVLGIFIFIRLMKKKRVADGIL